jgi:hypothetical protein
MKVRKSLYRNLRIKLDGVFGPLPKPEKWVFIVGCYNSGTTLLHDLLASHPQVGSMPNEGQFYTDQLLLPKSVGLPRLWAIESDRFRLDENSGTNIDVKRLKRQWGARFNDAARPILLEKSPTNAGRMRWLQEHFENAHFIGIIRNGYAVAEGIHRKTNHPLQVAAKQWACSNEIMLHDLEALRYKKLVRYESLTASPSETMREILDFLNLSPLDFDVEDRKWRVHEQASRIRNMNQRSLNSLSETDKRVIEEVAGEMLVKLEYDVT